MPNAFYQSFCLFTLDFYESKNNAKSQIVWIIMLVFFSDSAWPSYNLLATPAQSIYKCFLQNVPPTQTHTFVCQKIESQEQKKGILILLNQKTRPKKNDLAQLIIDWETFMSHLKRDTTISRYWNLLNRNQNSVEAVPSYFWCMI